MKKICIFILLLALYIPIITIPPTLRWSENRCWHDSAIWFLYNAREFIEELIKNKKDYIKDELITSFIKLAEAIRAQPRNDTAVQKAADVFYSTTCTKVRLKSGEMRAASQLLDYFKKHATTLVNKYFATEFSYTKEMPDGSGIKEFPLNKTMLVDKAVPGKNLHYTVHKAPPYLLTSFSQPETFKLFGGDIEYELIGAIKEPPKVGPGVQHYYAYIKDQWEKVPSWWKCDDLTNNGVPQKSSIPGSLGKAMYKRVDTKTKKITAQKTVVKPKQGIEKINQLGQGLKAVAKKRL